MAPWYLTDLRLCILLYLLSSLLLLRASSSSSSWSSFFFLPHLQLLVRLIGDGDVRARERLDRLVHASA